MDSHMKRSRARPQSIQSSAWSAALEAQLALRLESEPAVPTQAIVIEQAELPSPNWRDHVQSLRSAVTDPRERLGESAENQRPPLHRGAATLRLQT